MAKLIHRATLMINGSIPDGGAGLSFMACVRMVQELYPDAKRADGKPLMTGIDRKRANFYKRWYVSFRLDTGDFVVICRYVEGSTYAKCERRPYSYDGFAINSPFHHHRYENSFLGEQHCLLCAELYCGLIERAYARVEWQFPKHWLTCQLAELTGRARIIWAQAV